METKMTYLEALTCACACDALAPKVRLKLKSLRYQYAKPKSGSGKPTKAQMENSATVEALYVAMELNRVYTCTELTAEVEAVKGLSCQKLSSLLKKLVDAERVKRLTEKGKTYYQKVEG